MVTRESGLSPRRLLEWLAWRTRGDREDGANLVEYAFILLLVVIVTIPFVGQIGQIVEVFYKVASAGFS